MACGTCRWVECTRGITDDVVVWAQVHLNGVHKVGGLLDVPLRIAILAGKDKLAVRDVLEHAGGGLELVEVVVCKGAVVLALVQCAFHVGSVPLVLHNANGKGAVMQQDEPCPAWWWRLSPMW